MKKLKDIMKKHVALMTIYQVDNYGSVLQTYATQKVLENLGYTCDVIKYKYPNLWHYQNGMQKPSLKQRIGNVLCLTVGPKRRRMFDRFREEQYTFTKEFSSIAELQKEDWTKYDAVIVGSDQVWKATFNYGDSAFLLSFVPDTVKKIAISSSFAMKTMPKEYREKYHRHLSKFESISVREDDGISILKNDLGLKGDFKTILDPTLLLTKEQWLDLTNSKPIETEPYILFYMLGYAFNPSPYIYDVAKYYAKKTGIRQIRIIAGDKKQFFDSNLSSIDCSLSSISEFINLLNGASMVVTSSFHGTAFATNFGKPLISVVPQNDQDGRLSSYLRNIGLTDCLAEVGSKFDSLTPQYDLVPEQKRLELLRWDSIKWIASNL